MTLHSSFVEIILFADMIIINIALTTAEGFTVTSGIYSPPVSADVVYDMSYACDRQGQYFSDGILAEDMPSWPRGTQ